MQLEIKRSIFCYAILAIALMSGNTEVKSQCAEKIYCPNYNQQLILQFPGNAAYDTYQIGDVFNFYFGPGSPHNGEHAVYNTHYTIVINPPKTQIYFIIPCIGVNEFVSITYPDGSICNYEYGQYCPQCPTPNPENEDPVCDEFIAHCEDEMATLITRNLKLEGCEQWAGDQCGPYADIYRFGRVGVGLGLPMPWQPTFAKLYVKSSILTEQMKVSLPGSYPGWGARDNLSAYRAWCDYVFDKNYKLMPLAEVEKFIRQNKHLPNTPSASQIQENGGFEMREVVLNHQEKIEEAFLHLIALKKQLDETKREYQQE